MDLNQIAATISLAFTFRAICTLLLAHCNLNPFNHSQFWKTRALKILQNKKINNNFTYEFFIHKKHHPYVLAEKSEAIFEGSK